MEYIGIQKKNGGVVEALQQAILSGQIPAGTEMTQNELAESLGVSRMPVREALMILEYQGLTTCSAASTLYGGMNQCKYGCLGLGDGTRACNFDAIKICDGVAVVARDLCTGCGACASACPKHVIRIAPAKNKVVVQCHSEDKGAATRKACSNGCIACGKCTKVCKFEAITVENNHAYIDPEKCKNCGLCAKECPTGAINNMRAKRKPAQAAAPAPAAEAKAEA